MTEKEHICYLSSPSRVSEDERNNLVFYTKKLLKKNPIDFSCIKIFEKNDYDRISKSALKCFENASALMGFDSQHLCSVVCCKMAMPHNDPSFQGDAFVSLVLHTGKGPYCFSMHSQKTNVKSKKINPVWNESRRFLMPGDILVINPIGLHSAFPINGSPDSMLILLQGVFPARNENEKNEIFNKFKKSIFDREEFDAEDLMSHNSLI